MQRYSKEIYFITQCCKVFLGTADAATLQQFVADWPTVYSLCTRHRIRPVVYKVICEARVPVDEQVRQQFHQYCKAFSIFAFDRQMESSRIQQLLRRNGVPVKLYKGLDFARTAYSDITIREFTDMDCMIDVAQVPALIAVMEAEGYESKGIEYFRRFPERFLTVNKDICFQKRCPRGGFFSFEFHYRPVKYIMDVAYSFSDILGKDQLLGDASLTHYQYYQLMLLNHGGSDYFPDLRSVLDMAMITRFYTGSVPVALQRFEQLWQLLAAKLFDYPAVRAAAPLQKTAQVLAKQLLTATGKPPKSSTVYLFKVGMHIRNSRYPRTKIRLLGKAVKFLLLPNENDIDGIRLPYFSLYYLTKPFRLLKGVLWKVQ